MEAIWHHVAVSVNDLDGAVHFFRDLLGFTVDWDMDHRCGGELSRVVGLPDTDTHIVMLNGYGTRIELFKYHRPSGEPCAPGRQCDFGITHFGFAVKNIQPLYERLLEAGVRFNCPPQNLRPGVCATYLQGPENITIELVEYDQPQ